MTKEERTDYNKLVGQIDGEYYFLETTFKHSDSFKGATGTVLRPIPKHEWEERCNPENIREENRDHWREAVSIGNTDDGLGDWMAYNDISEPYFDDSYSEYWDALRKLGISEEEYPVIECVGGGRSFSYHMTFDEVFDTELIKVINEFEEPTK